MHNWQVMSELIQVLRILFKYNVTIMCIKILMKKKKSVSIFTSYLLPLATVKVYPSSSKIGQKNPGIALKDFISAYFKCDFQIPHAKTYQNTSFRLPALMSPKIFQFKYR